jgi:hypothetical protein
MFLEKNETGAASTTTKQVIRPWKAHDEVPDACFSNGNAEHVLAEEYGLREDPELYALGTSKRREACLYLYSYR